ncbi:MAG TPA: MFS transporter, partial [Chthoniobacterales bacterium]|nr:MFS transporter [Chthoniobacterales bacterium]
MPDRKPHAPPPAYEAPAPERPTTAVGSLERTGRHDPYGAFRFRNFTFYAAGNLVSAIGRQMLTIAIEWEIYARTNSATALGLVGLAIALPVVLLSLPAGHIADRYSRKTILLCTQALSAICSLALALISWRHLAIPAWPILQRGNAALGHVASIFERHATYHFTDSSLPLI